MGGTRILTITFLLLLLFLPSFFLFFIYLIVSLLLPIFLILLNRKHTRLLTKSEHHISAHLLQTVPTAPTAPEPLKLLDLDTTTAQGLSLPHPQLSPKSSGRELLGQVLLEVMSR